MERLERTSSTNLDFIALVTQLDADLASRDGADNAFYAQFNGITHLNHAVVFYKENIPVACGAFKPFTTQSVEIKRMFVNPEQRGKGYATKVLAALETWAKELDITFCVLETGKRQPEAISLYKKNGYTIVPNYPPYEHMANSVCFKKKL